MADDYLVEGVGDYDGSGIVGDFLGSYDGIRVDVLGTTDSLPDGGLENGSGQGLVRSS